MPGILPALQLRGGLEGSTNRYPCVACKRKPGFCNRHLQSLETNPKERLPAASSRHSKPGEGVRAKGGKAPVSRIPLPMRCSTPPSCYRQTGFCSKNKTCSSAAPSMYQNVLRGHHHLSWLQPPVTNPHSQLQAPGAAACAPSGCVSLRWTISRSRHY